MVLYNDHCNLYSSDYLGTGEFGPFCSSILQPLGTPLNVPRTELNWPAWLPAKVLHRSFYPPFPIYIWLKATNFANNNVEQVLFLVSPPFFPTLFVVVFSSHFMKHFKFESINFKLLACGKISCSAEQQPQRRFSPEFCHQTGPPSHH